MRSTPLLQSHTPLTAMQEIAALILAYAVLVDYRIEAAKVGEVGVLRISFLKTLHAVQGLWQFLEVSADLLGPDKIRLLLRRTLRQIAEAAIPKRRKRSCPRALLTLNRLHFMRLHRQQPDHAGIIVCTFDPDFDRQGERIHQALGGRTSLAGQLVRVIELDYHTVPLGLSPHRHPTRSGT